MVRAKVRMLMTGHTSLNSRKKLEIMNPKLVEDDHISMQAKAKTSGLLGMSPCMGITATNTSMPGVAKNSPESAKPNM